MTAAAVKLPFKLPPWAEKSYALCFGTEARTAVSIFTIVLALGIPLGIAFPPNDPNYPDPWRRISGVIGWVYWSAWSVSFWPQVLVNFRRKSVEGLSFEYPTLNLLGFSCYTAYNAALYWNTGVRAEYAAANNGATPSVQSNDVFFAIHAVILTIVVLVQLCIYERGSQRLAWWCIIAIGCFLVAIVIVGLCTVWHASEWFSWLNFLIFLSYVKVAVTLIKYTPQAILNWRRQSTVGWSIDNILLDFTGGSLSLAQTLMDNGIKGQWGEIMGGNPAKFFLGFTSMVFDIVFMIQHYGLYRSNNARIEAEEAERAGGYTVLLGAAAGKARGPAAINGWVEE